MGAGFVKKCGFDIGHANYFITQDDIVFYSARFDVLITIRKGFYTDFDSVPNAFLWLIPPNREQRFPATLHDELYGKRGKVVDEVGHRRSFTRRECDLMYLEALNSEGFDVDDSYLSYFGLRIGGWLAWHFHKPKLLKSGERLRRKQELISPELHCQRCNQG